MNADDKNRSALSRRRFLNLAGGVVAAGSLPAAAASASSTGAEPKPELGRTEPFHGTHQGGIATPPQRQTYFAAFDLSATKRSEVIQLLRDWTAAAAKLTGTPDDSPASAGEPADSGRYADSASNADSGETLGMAPSRLTVTFGFGSGLFTKDGKDRYGLAAHRPTALVDLPRFHGDQLVEAHTGGDLSVQACADDPQVAFHAVRRLAQLAYGAAQLRWVQSGFLPAFGDRRTPRNLMGFKDGTSNPATDDPLEMEKHVWVGAEGPDWMRGGSYLVARRIRIALEHWDRMNLGFQEQTFGRHKISGAPLGKSDEFDPVDLDATDRDGNPVIPEMSHVRLANAASNDGARILRRAYSYNDGVNFTSERWPPWRQGMEYDAGLFFVCYQRDPRTGFIRIFDNMSKFDMLNQFVTHTGGGLFACPGGVRRGKYIGQKLLETA